MNNTYLVSIIIPAFNSELFIEKAINSVLNQTYKNTELIVVDDGSKDNTSKIVENNFLKFKNIKLIKQNNLGVSAARNKGLECVTGDFCIFLDADDWLDECCIETLLFYCEKNNNIFTVCDRYSCKLINNTIIKKDLKIISTETKSNIPNGIIHFVKYHLQSACYKLFDLKIIRRHNIKFPEGIAHGEDGLFVFRYLQHIDSFLYIPKSLWNILDNPNSVTKAEFNSSMISGIKAVELMIDENKKYKSEEVNEALFQYLLSRILIFAKQSLLSNETRISDRLFFKYKLKKCLYQSFLRVNINKNVLLAFIYIFSPRLLALYIKMKRIFNR